MEIPGNVPSMLEKARGLEPDVLMLDFEDSVPTTDDAKRQARRQIAEFVGSGRRRAFETVVRL
ncbi:MAG: aldolase/citrate lyase family protein, partial [Thermomicrobiales bacterium]